MALYHSAKGSVDYEVVGNPTITDGIASGFSSGNRLQTTSNFDFNSEFEFITKITTPNIFQTTEIIFGQNRNNYNTVLIWSSKFRFGILDNEYHSVHEIVNNVTVQPNTTYFIKLTHIGTTYTLSVSTDNENWTDTSYSTSSTLLGNLAIAYGGVVSSSAYFGGSIDLNETYIKINAQPWFGVCPVEVQKHQLKGPVGYTVVGSPTIVNGIASGFSKSDYLTLPSITNDFIKKLNQSSEIGTKLTTPTEEISQYAVQAFFIPYRGTAGGFSFYKEGKKIRWTILTNYYIETPSFNDGETVWLKGIRDNGIAELLYRTNGTSYISAGTLDISNIADPSAYGTNAIPKIGINGNTASGWEYTGSIDLNETYIKVDGKVWFYQPADTKYIVKDGKLVWADPRIYIDDNGTKTYATQNIAPVLAGFTFGTTTTPSIGYVDMRTQVFTAAPQGATIGREE